MNSTRQKRIAIIGGGITGLAAAYYLSRDSELSIKLFEASNRLGGVLRTHHHDGFLIENSADSFIANEQAPWAKRLCEELELHDRLLPTRTEFQRALVAFRGRLHPVPEGFQLMKPSSMWPIARSPLLTPFGKLRMAAERFVAKSKLNADESLEQFTKRRLGSEAFDRLVQPLVSGIYTADPAKLSMRAALPQFVKMEEQYGSLIAASRAQGKQESKSGGARYNLFYSLQDGMSELVEALRQRLDPVDIRLSGGIERVERDGQEWRLNGHDERFDHVVVALRLNHACKILADIDADLASEMSAVEHASSAVACFGYRNEQFARPLDAFGCVVPIVENRKVIAISFASMKFPGRAPAGHQLLRVFVGGAMHPQMTDLPDEQIIEIAKRETMEILGIQGEPVLSQVARWSQAMPQYHLGHQERVSRIAKMVANHPGLHVVSNGLDGVGLPHRVRNGMEVAEQIRLAQQR